MSRAYINTVSLRSICNCSQNLDQGKQDCFTWTCHGSMVLHTCLHNTYFLMCDNSSGVHKQLYIRLFYYTSQRHMHSCIYSTRIEKIHLHNPILLTSVCCILLWSILRNKILDTNRFAFRSRHSHKAQLISVVGIQLLMLESGFSFLSFMSKSFPCFLSTIYFCSSKD